MLKLQLIDVKREKVRRNEAILVTGNIKHYPREHFIVTPSEFLDLLNFD